MPRNRMRQVFGLGVDNVALVLRLKGYLMVEKKGGRIYYMLNKKG